MNSTALGLTALAVALTSAIASRSPAFRAWVAGRELPPTTADEAWARYRHHLWDCATCKPERPWWCRTGFQLREQAKALTVDQYVNQKAISP
jgi:hypothetical protein